MYIVCANPIIFFTMCQAIKALGMMTAQENGHDFDNNKYKHPRYLNDKSAC